MAFSYRILTQNGVNFTNIDEAKNYWFNSGTRDGIVKDVLNEGTFSAPSSNSIKLDTCELRIGGHRVTVDGAWEQTFTGTQDANTRYALVAQVVIDSNSAVSFSLTVQTASTPLVKNDLYKHENGAGTYEVEIGRFTLTTNGTVEDLTRTIDIITGGKGSGDGAINIGNVTTHTLEAGLEAEVDVEQRLNQEDGKTYTDFNFDIPKGDKGDTGATGVGISTITAGTPTASGGNTTTPITITLTNSDVQSFNVVAQNGANGSNGTNGSNGVSVTDVQVTYSSTDASGNNIYNVTSTIGGSTVNSGTITAPKGDTGTFESIDDTLSTTSENAVQNKVVTAAINANSTNIANLQSSKADGYSLTLTHNIASTNNWKYLVAKFLTINYSDYINGKGACIKLKAKSFKSGSMYNYDDDSRNFTIDEDIIIQKDGGSTTQVSIYRYDTIRYWWSFNNKIDCTFGDIFWTDDTTNKVLTFYMFCGENSSTQFTPYTSMNATTPTGITQHTGNAEYYSSGTINWAQLGHGTRVALKSEVDDVEDSLRADKMNKTNPTGTGSVSIGRKANTTIGTNSTAVGQDTTASGSCSHTEGYMTIANHAYQHVFGELNVEDTSTAAATSRGNYVEIVGNGTSPENRSNARTLDWNGNETIAGKHQANGGYTDGRNANYVVRLPNTTAWTNDKTFATTDDVKISEIRYGNNLARTQSGSGWGWYIL